MRRRRNNPLCKEGRRTFFVRRGDLFILKNPSPPPPQRVRGRLFSKGGVSCLRLSAFSTSTPNTHDASILSHRRSSFFRSGFLIFFGHQFIQFRQIKNG